MLSLELYSLSIIIIQFLMENMTNCVSLSERQESIPIVINTWGFTNATQKAWDTLMKKGSALDAIELGCSTCESEQCDHTVGWGGSPDENGETTLDAMIMDGPSHDIGAVGSLRRVKNAISVARKVLENTEHTFIVGELATNFAVQMGFKEESLTSDWSKNVWIKWRENKCQPNYWRNVEPNPKSVCGPYKPTEKTNINTTEKTSLIDNQNHDTIGMVAIDYNGNLAVGTSTNGMTHKIPGRVGDSPIPGSGAYADQDYGGAAATGDGDVIMRFLPSYQAVENLRQGMKPTEAAEDVMRRITKKYPKAQAAIVVADIRGNYGAACINIETGFPFSVCNPILGNVTQQRVNCISS